MDKKNPNRASLDKNQIYDAVFDGKIEALRVAVVEGIELNVDQINLPELKQLEKQVIVKELEVKEIKVPEIIKEVSIERIEVPVIVKEIVIKEVEKPVVVPEVRIIEIEKPVVIKEIEVKIVEQKIPVVPTIAKICMIIQALALVGILLTKAL